MSDERKIAVAVLLGTIVGALLPPLGRQADARESATIKFIAPSSSERSGPAASERLHTAGSHPF